MTDRGTLRAILEAAEVSPQDLVVEVGPGRGVLTRELALRAGRVVAVELDEELAAELRREALSNVAVVVADGRTVDVASLVGQQSGYKLLGNLPYYAASPIMRHFLEASARPSIAVVMLQKEVAEQVCASPGSMSLLSVAVQVYGRPRVVRRVPPGAFFPRPKVSSAVVRIDVYPEPALPSQGAEPFFRVARAGFSSPRKQLRNALAHGLEVSTQVAARVLERAGVDPRRRAQTLSLEEWRRVFEAVVE